MNEKKKRQQNRDMVLILSIPVAILGKIIQFYFLPMKYFYDSMRMQSMLNEDGMYPIWGGYESTVDVFRKINFFHFTTTSQWSISLGIVMTLFAIFILSRCKEMTMKDAIFALMSIGLLNIYDFNISKEAIQISFFFCILVLLWLPINNSFIKMCGGVAVFYWESLVFRDYYIVMAAIGGLMFFLIWIFHKRKERLTSKSVIVFVFFSIVIVLFSLYVYQYISYDEYLEVINLKDTSRNDYASTVINNYVEVNNNYGYFCLNYVINAIRMLLPIELFIKGPGYVPFVFYQLFILYYLIKALKNINKVENTMVVALSCFLAYIFGSILFEPDFGSWVRHESATFPILQYIAFNCESIPEEEEINYGKKVLL